MTDTPHDNDADGRPRIYKRATSKHGEVELVVKGAEGETIKDISQEATDQFKDVLDGQETLRTRDTSMDKRGVE